MVGCRIFDFIVLVRDLPIGIDIKKGGTVESKWGLTVNIFVQIQACSHWNCDFDSSGDPPSWPRLCIEVFGGGWRFVRCGILYILSQRDYLCHLLWETVASNTKGPL